jgi:hypothetical protein
MFGFLSLASAKNEVNYSVNVFLKESKELYLVENIDTNNKSSIIKNIFTGAVVNDKNLIDRINLKVPWSSYSSDKNAGYLIYRIRNDGRCEIHWVDKAGKIRSGGFNLTDIAAVLATK